ncbi:hypothetical protein ACIOKD_24840 [Streptomyces sp. NPDC087844]|uniref:hypothetical protein n=1 Tax=Streptomyces sp. NPDC087844 TaxID=3365805 RepID=UPI003803DE0B
MSSTTPEIEAEPGPHAPDLRDAATDPATGVRHTDVPSALEPRPEPTPAAPGAPTADTTTLPAPEDGLYSGYKPL